MLCLAFNRFLFICVCRNFPQGTISDMVNDTSQGISFIINNIANYGGDPNRWTATMVQDSFSSYIWTFNWDWSINFFFVTNNRVYLMGQSAGAHISSCALLEQAARETNKGENVSWSISQIKAYFGLSGG